MYGSDPSAALRPALTVALYGDQGVGKTTLCRRLCGVNQPRNTGPTLGYDVKEGRLMGTKVRWLDTSGAPRFVRPEPWLKHVDLVVFVFGTHNKASWLNLEFWLRRTELWHGRQGTRVAVGLVHGGVSRTVSMRLASATAMLIGAQYLEIDDDDATLRPLIDIVSLHAVGAHQHSTLAKRFSSGQLHAGVGERWGNTPLAPPSVGCISCLLQCTVL